MFINSGESKDHNDFVYDRMGGDAYSVTIAGSTHLDFTDMFYTTPVIKKLSEELIGDQRMLEVTTAYIVAFYDRYLKGHDSGLLDESPSRFSEVELKKIHGSG
jgi:hypothetical protein